jgi:hypothetical protein
LDMRCASSRLITSGLVVEQATSSMQTAAAKRDIDFMLEFPLVCDAAGDPTQDGHQPIHPLRSTPWASRHVSRK